MINTALPNLTAFNAARPVAESAQASARVTADDALSQSDASAGDNDQSANRSTNSALLANELTEQEQQEVSELRARDREVRAHEQAHANVGGRYAGSPTYTYQRGPDGRNYAVGGEVAIDVSPVPSDPEATIQKAIIVRRAALAPAEPSTQDRAVAAEATAIEQAAKAELLAERIETSSSQAVSLTSENIRQATPIQNFLSIANSASLVEERSTDRGSVDVFV